VILYCLFRSLWSASGIDDSISERVSKYFGDHNCLIKVNIVKRNGELIRELRL
jgi:hypothetical protein